MVKRSGKSKVRIVVIEDNPADVYLLKLALEQSGVAFDLTQFESGARAVDELCYNDDPRVAPDLILLDLNTPGSDGFEVIGAIKANAKFAEVPLAVVTSSTSQADRRRALQAGASKYIEKPTDLNAYLQQVGPAVKELLE